MTIERIATGYCITYDDDEWDFVETLPEDCIRNIKRGLLTPYDYGFRRTKPEQEETQC